MREDAWALRRCLDAALHASPADNTPPEPEPERAGAWRTTSCP
ncbi:hypothetical protein [Nonomuraea lactucae]|nr:hypothetical protein [Nonomuraea lactucae]